MSSSTHRYYPRFSLGQVLTHDQLNAVVDYLDAEDRLTRRWLLGAGIVCGLEVTSDLQSYVKVGRGCALTTRGDLLVVDEPLELRFSRKFHDEDAYFAPKFVDCIRELVDGSRQDAEPLQFKRLKERVVVLYLDVDDEKMSTCGAVDCNDLGRRRSFVPRVLLLSPTEVSLQLELPASAALPTLESLRLPHLDRVLLRGVKDSSTLKDVYKAGMVAAAKEDGLAARLMSCVSLLKPALGVETRADLRDMVEEVISSLDIVESSAIARALDPGFCQYYWDWLKDLAAASRELVEVVTQGIAGICPIDAPLAWHLLLPGPDRPRSLFNVFEQHVLLGQLPFTEQPVTLAAPGRFRYPFLRSPGAADVAGLRGLAARLLKRLVLQIEGFRWQAPQDESVDLTITPEAGPQAPLARRALPRYYDTRRAELAALWGAPHATERTLAHDFSDAAFFRIDGHIGKDTDKVLDPLKQMRLDHGLPFQILAVTLGGKTASMPDSFCPEELQNKYAAWRAPLRRALEREREFFKKFELIPPPNGTVVGKVNLEGVLANDVKVRVLGTDMLVDVLTDGKFSMKLPEGEYALQVEGAGESDPIYLEVKADTTQSPRIALREHVERSRSRPIVDPGLVDAGVPLSPTKSSRLQPAQSWKTIDDFVRGKLGERVTAPDALERLKDVLAAEENRDRDQVKVFAAEIYLLLGPALSLLPERLSALKLTDLQTNQDKLRAAAETFSRWVLNELATQGRSVPQESLIMLRQHVDGLASLAQLATLEELWAQRDKLWEQRAKLTMFEGFFAEHPSLEHLGGVPRGGTFVLVEEDGVVKADFALAYFCAAPEAAGVQPEG